MRALAALGLGIALLIGGPARAHDAASAQSSEALNPLARRFGGAFSLIDHTGRRVGNAEYFGSYTLIYFGYTRCGDLCPADLQTIGLALTQAGAVADKVQPLFISVDPAFDTPGVLADYVRNFHPQLTGLTGTQAEVDAAAKAWHVHVRKVDEKPVLGKADFFIDHSSLAYLMAPDGTFVTLFPHRTTPDQLAAALRSYVK